MYNDMYRVRIVLCTGYSRTRLFSNYPEYLHTLLSSYPTRENVTTSPVLLSLFHLSCIVCTRTYCIHTLPPCIEHSTPPSAIHTYVHTYVSHCYDARQFKASKPTWCAPLVPRHLHTSSVVINRDKDPVYVYVCAVLPRWEVRAKPQVYEARSTQHAVQCIHGLLNVESLYFFSSTVLIE